MIYLTLDRPALAAKADPRRSFLVFDLEIAGKKVSRNLVFFGHMHDLELPVAPKIESNLSKSGDGYALILRTPALARNVYVAFGDLDVQVSDNYFDLLPGEPLTITLKSVSTLDQLKSALQVTVSHRDFCRQAVTAESCSKVQVGVSEHRAAPPAIPESAP